MSMFPSLLVILAIVCFLWSSSPLLTATATTSTGNDGASHSTDSAVEETPSTTNMNQAIVNAFYMALTEKTINATSLKQLLQKAPKEDRIFKSLNKYLSSDPPRSSEEEIQKLQLASPMAKFPVLHHLLNHYMLSKAIDQKVEILDIIHLTMTHGLDISIPLNNDPPFFVKTLMVREMELTRHVLEAGAKFVTNEVIARSAKLLRFFNVLYNLPTEVVPIAKLLLHVEKLSQLYSARLPENSGMNATTIALSLLDKARLDKPTILAPELIQYSKKYCQLVDHITNFQFIQQVDDLERKDMLEMTKILSLQDMMMTLNDLVVILLNEIIHAMEQSDRRIVAIEHFFDLHLVIDAQDRNLFHFLTLGNNVKVFQAMHDLVLKLEAEVKAQSSTPPVEGQDPLDPNHLDQARLQFIAQKLLTNVQQIDVRGHSPLSFATTRYGEEAEITVVYKKFMGLLAHIAFASDGDESEFEYDLLEGEESEEDLEDAEVSVAGEVHGDMAAGEEPVEGEELLEEEEEGLKVEEVESLPSEGAAAHSERQRRTEDASTSREVPESDDGGWNTEKLSLPFLDALEGRRGQRDESRNQYSRCDIVEVWDSSLPSAEEFFARYINTATPVVFRGAALRNDSAMNALRTAFAKKKFMKNYGKVAVPSASIPYGDSFGVPSNTKTMKEVANTDAVVTSTSAEGSQDRVSIPLYTFTTANAQWAQRLNRDVPVPEPLRKDPNSATNPAGTTTQDPNSAYSFELQFYLGPAGTGAPVHFHGHAMNTLAYGEKKWVLYPPSAGFYSTIPALEFFEKLPRYQHSTMQKHLTKDFTVNEHIEDLFHSALQCTQYAGDIMYVPTLWAHGTLNTKQSIGVAHEFSVESFCME